MKRWEEQLTDGVDGQSWHPIHRPLCAPMNSQAGSLKNKRNSLQML